MEENDRTIVMEYEILFRSNFIYVAFDNVRAAPPTVEVHPEEVLVDVSGTLTVDCRASGRPEPTVTWTRAVSPLSCYIY